MKVKFSAPCQPDVKLQKVPRNKKLGVQEGNMPSYANNWHRTVLRLPYLHTHTHIYIRGLLEKYPTVFCYANT
jgi:hypothetical protein